VNPSNENQVLDQGELSPPVEPQPERSDREELSVLRDVSLGQRDGMRPCAKQVMHFGRKKLSAKAPRDAGSRTHSWRYSQTSPASDRG
jgi:hypothetical protein